MIVRRGVSLIEVLSVIALGGTILILAVQLWQQNSQASRQSLQVLELERGLHRLAPAWRADLRQADEAEMSDSKTLILRRRNEEIRWEIEPELVRRTALVDGTIDREEGYRCPGAILTFVRPDSAAMQLEVSHLEERGGGRFLIIWGRIGQ